MDKRDEANNFPQLLDLSDCVLLPLLSYLDATSLYNLSRTCQRLKTIVEDVSLWRTIDARQGQNTVEKLKYCCERITNQTSKILFRGEDHHQYILPENFFTNIYSYNYVKVLALENQSIEGDEFNITFFPKSLEELSLRKTKVTKPEEFFRHSESSMRSLRVLILDECDWLVSSCLMSISRYKNLEVLSLFKCIHLENSIPYLSLSAQLGFKNLKILDTRLSVLGNTLLRSFYNSTSLIGIYLQNKDLSYKIDCLKAKLSDFESREFINNKENQTELSAYDYFETENLSIIQNFQNENGGTGTSNSDEPHQLDDLGLFDYLNTYSDNIIPEYPKSVLYVDPYGECTCNYEINGKEAQKDDDSSGDDEDMSNATNKDIIIKKMKRQIRSMRNVLRISRCSVHLNNVNRGGVSGRGGGGSSVGCSGNCSNNGSGSSRGSSSPPYSPQAKRLKLDYSTRNNSHCHACFSKLNPSGSSSSNSSSASAAQPNQDELYENDVVIIEPIMNRPPTPHPEFLIDDDDDGDDYVAPPILLRQTVCFGRGAPQIIRLVNNPGNYESNHKIPLKRLSLRGYKQITNNALRYIKRLDLDILDITYTSITTDAINDYLIEHPSCRIIHESLCKCALKTSIY